MSDPRTALAHLVAKLSADGELSDADLATIHDAALTQVNTIVADREWAAAAHVHDASHLPVITFDPEELEAYLADPDHDDEGDELPPGDRIPEHVDASAIVCHDCRRGLINDVGDVPLLVCPTLAGRRPRDMIPAAGGAVECGRP